MSNFPPLCLLFFGLRAACCRFLAMIGLLCWNEIGCCLYTVQSLTKLFCGWLNWSCMRLYLSLSVVVQLCNILLLCLMFPDHLEMLSKICCTFSKFIFFLWKISRSFWTIWFVCWRGTRFFSVRWKICRSSSTICFVSWLNRRSFCVSGSMFCTNEKKVGWGKKFIEREKIRLTHLLSKKKMKFISVKKLARRVVYKLQESLNSVILFNAFVASINNITRRYCKSPMALHEDRSTHENHWGFNSRSIVIVLINNAIVCRSSLKSRFVSISHCNLNFWDFFEDHVVSLKKKVFNRMNK